MTLINEGGERWEASSPGLGAGTGPHWSRTGGDAGDGDCVDHSPSCIWEQEAGFSPTNTKQQDAATVRACRSDAERQEKKGEVNERQQRARNTHKHTEQSRMQHGDGGGAALANAAAKRKQTAAAACARSHAPGRVGR